MAHLLCAGRFAWSGSARPDAVMRVHAGPEQLDAFLRSTRVLVCMLPLTPQTQHIIHVNTLSKLMPGACLINVAHGGHFA